MNNPYIASMVIRTIFLISFLFAVLPLQSRGEAVQPLDSAKDVSDRELQKYYSLKRTVRKIEFRYEQQRMNSIQQSGISVKKFHRIRGLINEDRDPAEQPRITKQDVAVYKKLKPELKQIKSSEREAVQKRVQKRGMTYERYQAIDRMIIENKQVRERYLELIDQGRP